MPELCIEGRHVTLVLVGGSSLPIAICGLCSALIAVEDEGELRHAVFHNATDTIASPWLTA